MDKEKIELIIKSVTRTDSYLNYANTKSTILLTLASAILTIVGVNISKVIPCRIHELSFFSWFLFLFFLISGVLFNVLSIIKSLGSMTPFIKESKKENIFSFVDIVHYYKNGDDYFKRVSSEDYVDMGMQLSLLNYTLSEGLIKKYKGQKISIFYLKVSLVSFLLGVLIPWIESSLMLFNDEVSGVVFLSLIVMLLVMVVIVLIFTLVFLLFIGKNKNEH